MCPPKFHKLLYKLLTTLCVVLDCAPQSKSLSYAPVYGDCDLIYPCSDTPDRKSEITRDSLAGSYQEAAILALFQEYVLCLLTGDVCMKPSAWERLHRIHVSQE